MIQAVLFDMDGVLMDSYWVWYQLMNAAAQDFGCKPVSKEDFAATFGQGVAADAKIFFPPRTTEEVEAYYNAHFLKHLDHMETDPSGPQVFAELKKNGIKTAVITNTPAPMAAVMLKKAGITPPVLIGGTDVPKGKPAPDMVHRALEKLATPPQKAIVIGDSPYDRQAAQAAGVPFVGFGLAGPLTIWHLEWVPRLVGI